MSSEFSSTAEGFAVGGGAAARAGVKAEVKTGLDTTGALSFMLDPDHHRMAVLPSLVENSPLSILELIGAGAPFIASTAGGIPEAILALRRRPAVSILRLPDGGKKACGPFRLGGLVLPRPSLSVEANERHWREYHSALAEQSTQATAGDVRMEEGVVHAGDARDLAGSAGSSVPVDPVRVCAVVATTEVGPALRGTLRSLFAQEFPIEDCVVVPAISPAPHPLEAIGPEAYGELTSHNWRWLEPSVPPSVLAAARNLGAAAVNCSHVLFVDGGSFLEPQAVGALARAVERSPDRHNAVATPLVHFYGGELPGEGSLRNTLGDQSRRLHVYLGAAIGLGAFRNVYGGPVTLVAQRVLLAQGGFSEHLHPGYDHWEFLARTSLAGVPLEVVPQMLVWARPQNGVYRSRRDDPHVQYAIQPYLARLPVEQHAGLISASSLAGVLELRPDVHSAAPA
ncbi:hypothetical protein CYMTET_24823 [Cymbomonas tetramitiformis]|uniref:Glycosyltransferase 2-like prokaryotic type domain-containing protein n=1 Tax=Cymbomonas tetramitiformis TaxID=36881 RepID=A0AAE0FVB1_9CHLO|nr:hypothetical protein CYMTET_24823 [Cymbomonas tetramitiformis]